MLASRCDGEFWIGVDEHEVELGIRKLAAQASECRVISVRDGACRIDEDENRAAMITAGW